MHPESVFVKRRSQPVEEHRSEKLLDQIHACPELGEGMPSASRAVASPCKHYSYCMEQTRAAWI
jgi:hypothetical protein